jgi:DNA modification methylase
MMDEILTGDCLEILPTIEAGSVQLVMTSPPYPGQMGDKRSVGEWLGWFEAVLTCLLPVMTADGVLALNVMFKRTAAGWFDHRLLTAVPGILQWCGLNLLDVYMWHKTNAPQNGPLDYCDAPGYELVYVYTNANTPAAVTFNPQYKPYAVKSINGNGQARIGYGRLKEPNGSGARQTNVISLPTVASDGNRPRAEGVSFPLALAERFILQYTRPGGLVLDPFAGVGTTCRVAAENSRRYIGIEIDPDEADKARRWLLEPLQLGLPAAANGH